MPSPRPRPVALKLLEGRGTGKDGISRDSGGRKIKNAPNLRRIPPDKPGDLTADAAEMWDMFVAELSRADVLRPLDGPGLRVACETYSRWRQAHRMTVERDCSRRTPRVSAAPRGWPSRKPRPGSSGRGARSTGSPRRRSPGSARRTRRPTTRTRSRADAVTSPESVALVALSRLTDGLQRDAPPVTLTAVLDQLDAGARDHPDRMVPRAAAAVGRALLSWWSRGTDEDRDELAVRRQVLDLACSVYATELRHPAGDAAP